MKQAGRTALDFALTESSQCLHEMKDFNNKKESPSYYMDVIYAS
jgi:hypothetical protein